MASFSPGNHKTFPHEIETETETLISKMNASIIRYSFHQMNTKSHSIGSNVRMQLSKSFYSRLPGRISKEIKFSHRSFSTKSTTTNKSGPIVWYLGMIKAKPILTKSITSALIFTAADFTSQTMTRTSSESYDYIRTFRMAGYGMIVLGPILHFWFNFVSRMLPKQNLTTTFQKMFIGQTVFGPVMNALFFSVNAALQGESGNEIVARLKRDMVPTMINNVIYWPICDFITFRFVPVHLQPLMSNSFSYVWTIYITYMASLSKAGPNQSNTSTPVE